jgi:hypothetical protein
MLAVRNCGNTDADAPKRARRVLNFPSGVLTDDRKFDEKN